MASTTIKIHEETKHALDSLREYKNESYDEVINKVVYIVKTSKTQPELSKEAILAIDKARERIKKGMYVNEADAKKRLGFWMHEIIFDDEAIEFLYPQLHDNLQPLIYSLISRLIFQNMNGGCL